MPSLLLVALWQAGRLTKLQGRFLGWKPVPVLPKQKKEQLLLQGLLVEGHQRSARQQELAEEAGESAMQLRRHQTNPPNREPRQSLAESGSCCRTWERLLCGHCRTEDEVHDVMQKLELQMRSHFPTCPFTTT